MTRRATPDRPYPAVVKDVALPGRSTDGVRSMSFSAGGRMLTCGGGRACQTLLATPQDATRIKKRGFNLPWMTWRAVSPRP